MPRSKPTGRRRVRGWSKAKIRSAPVPTPTARSLLLRDLTLLFGLWLVFVVPFLAAHRTILPIDHWGVMPYTPSSYSYSEPVQPHQYSLDPDASVAADAAWDKYTADSVRRGAIPFWNPYQGLGAPFLAEADTHVLYPLNLLHILVPTAYRDCILFFHLLLAAIFLYFLACECGLDRGAAVVAGACVYTGGFFQGFLAFTMFLAGVAWLPLLLFGLERAFHRNSIRGSFLPIAIGTFMILTGAHPAVVVACVLTVAGYVGLRCALEGRFRIAAWICLPALAGVLSSAPAWVPFVDYVRALSGTLGRPQAVPFLQLPSVVFPFVYGALFDPGTFGNPQVQLGARPLPWIPAGMFFLAFTGMAFAIWRRARRILPFAAIALSMALWCLDVPPFNLLSAAPLLKRVTVLYLLLSIQLCCCILAGYGCSQLRSAGLKVWAVACSCWALLIIAASLIAYSVYSRAGPADPSLLRAGALAGFAWAIAVPCILALARFAAGSRNELPLNVVALLAVVLSGIAFFPTGASFDNAFLVRSVTLAVFLLLAAVVAAAARRLRPEYVFAPVVLALIATNVFLVARWPGWPRRADPFRPPPFVNYLKAVGGAWRSYGIDGYLFPDYSSPFAIPTIDLMGTLLPETAGSLMVTSVDECQNPEQFYGLDRGGPCRSLPVPSFVRHRPMWDYLGVRYVIGSNDVGARIKQAESEISVIPVGPEYPIQDFEPVPLNGTVLFPVKAFGPFKRVRILLSTYARNNFGTLTFDLADAKGKTVLRETRDTASLAGNAYAAFSLPPGRQLDSGVYQARLSFEPSAPGSAIAVWRDKVRAGNYRFALDSLRPAGIAPVFEGPPGSLVWENAGAQPPAYLAPETQTVADWREAQFVFGRSDDLHRTAFVEARSIPCANHPEFPREGIASTPHEMKLEPNRITARFSAATPGTLVLVENYFPGWTARLDGAPARVTRVNGAFHGVCVDAAGNHQVVFEYQPPLWTVSLILAGLGFTMAAAYIGVSRKAGSVLPEQASQLGGRAVDPARATPAP